MWSNRITMQQLMVFFRLLERDLWVFAHDAKKFFINYTLILPTVSALCFGYLFPFVAMHAPTPEKITLLIVGYSLWPLFLVAYNLTITLVFDLEGNRCIDYHNSVLTFWLVLLEKIVFTTLVSWLLLLPFYPLIKLILGKNFVTATCSWPAVYCILAVGAAVCSAFAVFFACLVRRVDQIGNYFMRINYPLIILGGTFSPWYVYHQYSHVFGTLIQLNPFLYITEGIRQAISGGPQFFSLAHAVGGCLFFSVVFTLLAVRSLKKRIDAV